MLITIGEKVYVSPVGDDWAKTRVYVYNPNTIAINMTWTYLAGGNGTQTSKSKMIPAGKSSTTDVIPTNTGVRVTTSEKALALSYTDTEGYSRGRYTEGQWHDWGFSMLPPDALTSQLLVGWG